MSRRCPGCPGSLCRCPRSPRGRRRSLSLRPKGRVLTHMEVDVSVKRTIRLKSRPSSPAGRIAFVVAVPRELQTGAIVDRRFPAIHPSLDSDESEVARLIGPKFDERGTHEIEGVSIPNIHLLNAPP